MLRFRFTVHVLYFRFTIHHRDGVNDTNLNADPSKNKFEEGRKMLENDSEYSVTNRHMLENSKTQTYNHKEHEFAQEMEAAVSPDEMEELRRRKNMNDVMLPGVLLEGKGENVLPAY